MDWKNILASVIVSLISSSVIASAIVYILKRSFDKSLDLKYEQWLERFKLEAQEQSRRKSKLFDKQAQVYQISLTLVYRLRNIARDLKTRIHLVGKRKSCLTTIRSSLENYKTIFLKTELYCQKVYFL